MPTIAAIIGVGLGAQVDRRGLAAVVAGLHQLGAQRRELRGVLDRDAVAERAARRATTPESASPTPPPLVAAPAAAAPPARRARRREAVAKLRTP